jgi:KH domain
MTSAEGENVKSTVFGSDFFSGDFKLSMWIPAELAGKVIGIKGVTIKNIERETKCNVVQALKPVGESLWTAVVIIGEAYRCQAAYNAVVAIVNGGELL